MGGVEGGTRSRLMRVAARHVARRADQLLVEAWSSRKSFVESSNNNSNVGSGLMQRIGGGGVKNGGGVGFSAGFGS
ncbi:uncharacterized protein A4U43_C08F15070 [Asparagus officinalis]|nr:uncharacterized protein A4U43_C08F15070 [Asparagus officinalis]